MSTTKSEVRSALKRLPDTCTLEDVQYQLYVIAKAQRGFKQVDEGRGISHAQAKNKLKKWLAR